MKVLLFGATGTAGGGILRACLDDPAVDEVRALVRRPMKLAHEKLRAIDHHDYLDYTPIAAVFEGVDACLYALGISVTQTSDDAEYRTIIHDYALAAARQLKAGSPNAVLHYISGQGTRRDSRMMWARVKGETERDLPPIVDTVCWRPGYIDGGVTNKSGPRLYRAIRPAFRLLRNFRSIYVTSEDIGRAMIQATVENVRGGVIENRRIRELAQKRGTAKN
jgi:uncharacterized protein YbjT (DUF2867 family)